MKNKILHISILSICILSSLQLYTSCISNDIPYPVIPIRILSLEVEGGSTTIDNNTRTVTLNMDETVDLRKVTVTQCTVTEGIEAPIAPGTVLDLSTPLTYTLSLYQDYEWTVQAVQNIERLFSVEKQMGKAVFNTQTHQVLAYISRSSDIRTVKVKKLNLGPAAITEINATQVADVTDFTLPKTVTITYHGDIKETWTVMVSRSDKNVVTNEADAWVNVAWLHGNGEDGADNGFEIRESSQTEWTKVSKENITESEGTLTACVSGLKATTSYTFRAYSGDEYGDEMTFTTTSAVELPDGSFDNWHQEGKIWNPWAIDTTPIWDSGNDGATTLGDSNTQPTGDTWNGKGQAARLESKFVGVGSIGKFAAGNLFIGTYKETDGSNGILDFGKPFTARPTKLRGHYKYTTAPIAYVSSGYEHLKEKPDTCAIYVALGDWPEPVEIRTNPSNLAVFNKNDSHVIAYAEFYSGETTTEYKSFELTLDYRDTGRIPTYLILVCSASKFGDYFVGGPGSILYVDDFSFEYDY